MCGIAGYIGIQPPTQNKVEYTLSLMKNRGPDMQSFTHIPSDKSDVVLLHSRLGIIDLDPRSNQPMIVGGCTVVFNGEIYNYLELHDELAKCGVQFKTKSDTEVLLQSYLAWGERFMERFEGMWAFALWDANKKILLLSRDRFGEKPLYLLKVEDGLYFGSEVKYLQALSGRNFEVNIQHVLRYLVNGYRFLYKTQDTFYKNVVTVPYATNVKVTSDVHVASRSYWAPHVVPAQMTLDEAVEGFRARLMESMKLRLRSDVPLAFCLSGGVDSASLVSIAAKQFGYKVATFSILDSDPRYNERDNIKATIDDLNCAHTLIEVPKTGFSGRLERLIKYHDSPLSTISYYIHSFLSETIAENGYRVVISGTAADELMTGYYDHFNLHLYEMRHHPRYQQYLQDWKTHIAPVVRNPHLANPELYFENPDFRDHINLNSDVFSGYLRKEFHEEFIEEKFCDSLLRNRMLNELFHEGIPVILHEDDLNSMYYSVENRSPYLDSRLFAFAYSIPSEYLIRDGYGKYILRQAVAGILNDTVRLDRRKKGFNASIHSLIDLDDKKNKEWILSDGKIYEIVDRAKLAQLIDQKPTSNSYSKFIFSIINAKIFLEMQV